MLRITILVFIVTFALSNSMCQSSRNSVIMFELKDSLLKGLLKDYLIESESSIKDIGVPIVKLIRSGDTITYYITYIIYQDELKKDPPTFCSSVEGKPVLLYTGFEYLSESKTTDFKEVLQRLYKNDMEITYSPAIWKVSVAGDKLLKKEYIEKLPY